MRSGRHFPNRAWLFWLVGVDAAWEREWAVGRSYSSRESMNKLTEPTQEEVAEALVELQTA